MPPAAARRWIVLVSVLSCSLLTATRSDAWSADPTKNLAIATGVGTQFPTWIAPDGAGGAIIVWSDSSSGSAYDVRATHVKSNGVIDPAWPANGVAVCTASGDQSGPRVVSDNAGGAIITWADQRSGNYDIYAHRVLASGTTDPAWPVNGAVVAGGTGDQFAGSGTGSHAFLIPDGSGGAFTAWVDSRTGDIDIYVHHIQTSGVDAAWPAGGRAVCTATSLQQAPALIRDNGGGVIVAWFDYRLGSFNSDIYVHHVQSGGTLDGNYPVNGLAVCTAVANQGYPEGVPDGSGGAILTWSDRRTGNTDVYAHHVMSDGTLDPAVTSDGVVISGAAGDQTRARMVPDGANGAIVSWYDLRDGVNEAVYAHHVTAACQVDPAWPVDGLAIRIDCGDSNPGFLSARGFVSDGAGGAIISWQDNRSGNWDIYAQRMLPSGVVDPAWPVEGRAVSTASDDQIGPIAGAVGGGKFVIAWFDRRNGTYDAYTQRVTQTGELGGADFAAGPALPNLQRGSLDWGDYDGDGDLDLLMTGFNGAGPVSMIYANTHGNFTDIGAGLPGIEWSSAEWGDYDRDGDLDFAMAGYAGGPALTRIYRNDAGVFTDIGAALPNVWAASVAWGDYDGDNDLDLVLVGQQNNTVRIARMCRNDGGTFTTLDVGLVGVANGDADWADFDLDGDLDLVIAGNNGASTTTTLYENQYGSFVSQGQSLPGVEGMDGCLAWGDYDADGDPDLLVSGWDQSSRHLTVLRNDEGNLNDIDANLPGVSSGAVAWGDYDNDGDLDILASGYWGGGSSGLTRIYRNDGGVFVDAVAGLPGRYYSAVAWADYDNDGDLDVTTSGSTTGFNALTNLFKVDGPTPNAPPAAPTNLFSSVSGGHATLSWTAPADDATPSGGLTYNLRMGSASGTNSIVPSMSGANGYRRIVRAGNVGGRVTCEVQLPQGPFYWSIQAVDGAFAGSAFTSEISVGVGDAAASGPPGIRAALPNPFRTGTEILFNHSRRGRVDLSIYDLGGRRVRVLERGERPAGLQRVTWDGRGSVGERLHPGAYWVRLATEAETSSFKVILTE